LVPSNYFEWITVNYGAQWEVVAKAWHWWNDPRNFLDEVALAPKRLPPLAGLSLDIV
jgi:hypothetical protein